VLNSGTKPHRHSITHETGMTNSIRTKLLINNEHFHNQA
jgi:hypothetical protein